MSSWQKATKAKAKAEYVAVAKERAGIGAGGAPANRAERRAVERELRRKR